jgi:cobyrinic acid a,c-diamide synthase
MTAFVIAAPASGSGKTTVAVGLMAAFRRRGLAVAPFKVGPDFIDPGYHRLACGIRSINLDGWICSPEFLRETYFRHGASADIAVIEGVMGLFDGMGGDSEAGSTAQVAKLLGAPVVLVVNAASQARSVAALVKGFVEFDPQVRIAGVLFNNVASDNHARILREAMASGCSQVQVLGCIPRDESMHMPSRHLGLVTAEEKPLSGEFLERLADLIEQHVDVETIRAIRGQVLTFDRVVHPVKCQDPTPPFVRVAVARDEAFCFIYEDNLRLLREAGAEIVEFSPLHDDRLPEEIDGLYLPGGYPEIHADQLTANAAMKEAIRDAVLTDMPVYAECGGFVYLTEGLRGQFLASDRRDHPAKCQTLTPFVGIFPVAARMLPRRKALGYREVEFTEDCVISTAGSVARGHEFHYSEMEDMPSSIQRVYRVRRQGTVLGLEGFRIRNCLASYVHLHFGSCPDIPQRFVQSCRENHTSRNERRSIR